MLTNNHLLTINQRTYLQSRLLTFSIEPKVTKVDPSTNWFRELCIRISGSNRFEIFIVIAILLNTCVLASTYFMMPEAVKQVLEALNILFMVIFALEAVIRITALKTAYFKDNWNLFDFIIITLAVLLMIPISLGYFKQ